MARIRSENWSEKHAAVLKIDWRFQQCSRARPDKCREVSHNTSVSAVEFWSLAGTCLALVNGTDFWGTVSFIVLFRRKLFQISIADETGLYKSEYSKVTWSHHFADSERKDVYSYECYDCNHDDRNNKPCITCLDGHCDVLCDENILNSESPWVQFSPSSRYWDGRRYKTDRVARWSSTKTEANPNLDGREVRKHLARSTGTRRKKQRSKWVKVC